MMRFLRRLWQWLVARFRGNTGRQKEPEIKIEEIVNKSIRSDAEYEQIFMKLLDTVAAGITPGGIKGFLFSNNISESELVNWLQGFGARVLASSAENEELATRLMQLGEVANGELARVAKSIGKQLIDRKNNIDYKQAQMVEKAKINASESHNAEDYFNKGIELYNLGKYEAALSYFDKAIEIKPDFYPAWCTKGSLLSELGRYEDALSLCTRLLEIKPDFYQIWGLQGDILYNLREYKKAIFCYNKALQIKSDFYPAWNNQGNALINLGKYKEGIASYEKVLEIKPDFYHIWACRGDALEKFGEYEASIASYKRALEIKPDFYQVWEAQALPLEKLGRYEEALICYDKALEIQPNFIVALNNRGRLLCDFLGKYTKAIIDFDQALKYKPDLFPALYCRGVVLEKLEKYEEAIASYDKALTIKHDEYKTWQNRGIVAGRSSNCNPLLANSSYIARQNPELNQRGYEGQIVSYREGLKYIHQDTHPEGWGKLHQAIGNAHYYQWQYRKPKNSQYWREAIQEYEEAYKTLKDFPEHHLELLQDFIRAYLDRDRQEQAEELQRRAWDIFQDLLDKQPSDTQKRLFSLKYAWLEKHF